MKKTIQILFLTLILTSTSCIKTIDIINSNNADSILVVNATITDQFKTQTVQLSRSFDLSSQDNVYESNATVTIKDNEQNIFQFIETSEGIYTSTQPFKADINKEYILKINTTDGESYLSSAEKIAGINLIDDIEINAETNNLGEEGFNIIVKSNSTDNNAKYYRYEYEETYKIIAPKWVSQKLIIISDVQPFSVRLVPDLDMKRYCYKTVYSNSITQTETNSLQENNVDFKVLYINKNEFKVSHRYSILVKQYVQSFEAYTFYKTLNKLSLSQGSFTQTQPGFVLGNIRSVANLNDKIIGFFEVASVSEKRAFFNRRDYYPGLTIKYVNECVYSAPKLREGTYPNFYSPLIEHLRATLIYYRFNSDREPDEGPYDLVPRVCGDCRVLATSIKPAFWVD